MALSASLNPEDAEFLRRLAQLVREAKDQPTGNAAWPAIEQHWDKALRRYVEGGLNQFLPQVLFLTESGALYKRGLALLSPNSALQDFDEAAQCLRKAAEQGHAGAQMNLGVLYERGKGVRQDFAEAMHWYRKAAEQREPHATCRVADLYRDGKSQLGSAGQSVHRRHPTDLSESQRSLH